MEVDEVLEFAYFTSEPYVGDCNLSPINQKVGSMVTYYRGNIHVRGRGSSLGRRGDGNGVPRINRLERDLRNGPVVGRLCTNKKKKTLSKSCHSE